MDEESMIIEQGGLINTAEHASQGKKASDNKDNGILEFMTPERAIELYKEIISNGIPKLDWKFYGRRKAGKTSEESPKDKCDDSKETNLTKEIQGSDSNLADDFDFDEEFGDYTAPLGSSLQLKKRPGQDSDKKTKFSDIMSDIMKQSHSETIGESSLMQDSSKDCTINQDDSNAMLIDPQPDDDRTELDDIQEVFAIEQEIKNDHQSGPISGKVEEDLSVNQVVNEIQTELMRELEAIPQVPAQECQPGQST